MNTKNINILIFCLSLLLSACTSPSINDYAKTTPALALEDFFDGKLKAYGLVMDMNGKVTRRFTVRLEAQWQEKNKQLNGEIKEWFEFDDGECSTRTWQITKSGLGQYQGNAEDVPNTAYGKSQGAALNWRYDLDIKVDGEEIRVELDDWLYLIDQNHLMNKTDIIKYGFKVGEIILMIEKL